jgi:hypothetical protein
MAIHYSRISYQILKYSVTCMTISIFLLFCTSFTIQSHSLFHLNPFQIQYKDDLLYLNQSSSSLTYHIEQTKFYPYLPIQIYTKNLERFLKLNNKTKKIILIGNPMFDDSTWTMKSLINKTNSGNSMYKFFFQKQKQNSNNYHSYHTIRKTICQIKSTIYCLS